MLWIYEGICDGTTQYFYNQERSETIYAGRSKAFVGHVGLMFPSDYGYATGGGSTGRSACLAKTMYSWDSLSNCYNNDWLYSSSSVQWTLTPNSGSANTVFSVDVSGYVRGRRNAYLMRGVHPVVYLKSNIKIFADEMDGSSGKPYNLSFKSIK